MLTMNVSKTQLSGMIMAVALLAMACCLLLSPMSAYAADDYLSAPVVAGSAGDTIQVPITLTSTGNVGGVNFDLAYDKSLLTLVSINRDGYTAGEAEGYYLFQGNLDLIGNGGNVLRVTAANMASSSSGLPTLFPAGSGTVAVLTFTVNSSATQGQSCALEFSGVKLSDKSGNVVISTDAANGQFSVPTTATEQAKYIISPIPDDKYTIGETDGIATMTANAGTGFTYFNTGVTPVVEHEGMESVVFIYQRNGAQYSMNVTKADFDLVSKATAGFNIAGNSSVVKVFIVDELTNDLNFNPTILQ